MPVICVGSDALIELDSSQSKLLGALTIAVAQRLGRRHDARGGQSYGCRARFPLPAPAEQT
jgi:hypothetical protein